MGEHKSDTAKQLTIQYALIQACFWAGYMGIRGFTTVYLSERGFSYSLIGLVVALASGLSVILQTLLGNLSDRKPQIPIRFFTAGLLIAAMLTAAFLIVFPYNIIPVTFLVYVTMNTIMTATQPFVTSQAYDYINRGLHINFGLARGMGSISAGLSTAIVGKLVQRLGPDCIMPILIGAYTIDLALVLTFTRKHGIPAKAVPKKTDAVPAGVMEFFRQNRRFTLFLVGSCLLLFSYQCINTYLINIAKAAGGDSSTVGFELAIAAVCELLPMSTYHYLARRYGCERMLRVSCIFFLLKTVGMLLAFRVPVIYLAALMQVGGFGLYFPASADFANRAVRPADRVKGQALLSAASVGLATMAGSLIGGVIIDFLGIRVLMSICLVVCACGAVITWRATRPSGKCDVNRGVLYD